MLIRELPSPGERERQLSMVTDDDYFGIISACVRQRPTERPEMNDVIDTLRRMAGMRGFGEI